MQTLVPADLHLYIKVRTIWIPKTYNKCTNLKTHNSQENAFARNLYWAEKNISQYTKIFCNNGHAFTTLQENNLKAKVKNKLSCVHVTITWLPQGLPGSLKNGVHIIVCLHDFVISLVCFLMFPLQHVTKMAYCGS